MSKIVEVVRVVMIKSWTGNEQEMKNNEKVIKKIIVDLYSLK